MKKLGKYGLPLKVIFCSRCTRSNQRPHNVGEFKQTDRDTKKFVSLDNNNHICDACKFYEYKQSIDWQLKKKSLENYVINLENKKKVSMM